MKRKMFTRHVSSVLCVISFIVLIIGAAVAADDTRKKVLYVDSYHAGYPWSYDITRALLTIFKATIEDNNTIDDTHSPVCLNIVRMDTKLHTDEEFKQQAAVKVKEIIELWHPDVVIASDDNASKYVIAPYYKDSAIPFVFCGVNWDVSAYGFPCKNVTGMIEVSLADQLVTAMRQVALGDRVGFLGADNISNHKEVENYQTKLGIAFEKVVFVNDYETWKATFLQLQDDVDMLIMAPPSFIKNEGKQDAQAFIEQHSRIITGCVEAWILPYALICYAKSPFEQGRWAAQTALKILEGTSPADISIVTNSDAVVMLNMPLAKKMKVAFPMELMKDATLYEGNAA